MALRSLFGASQYTYNVIVVPSCINYTISTSLLSQKTDAISFLAGRRLFELFRLVWMCVHPLLSLLFGFNIHK
jgi:hypothetical protein